MPHWCWTRVWHLPEVSARHLSGTLQQLVPDISPVPVWCHTRVRHLAAVGTRHRTSVQCQQLQGARHVWHWTPVQHLETGGVQHVSGTSTQQVCQAPIKRLLWRAYNKSSRHCFLQFGPAQPRRAQCPKGTDHLKTRNPRWIKHRGYSIPSARAHMGTAPRRCITTTTQSVHLQGSPRGGGGRHSVPPETLLVHNTYGGHENSHGSPLMVTPMGVPLCKGR